MAGDIKMSTRYLSLKDAIAAIYGKNVHIIGRKPVYGGDINHSWRLSLSDGTDVFMKSNEAKNLTFFECETEGLNALRSTKTVNVPEPLAVGVDEAERMSFLLMEYLAPAPRKKNYWEILGRELAEMHRWNADKLVTGTTVSSDDLPARWHTTQGTGQQSSGSGEVLITETESDLTEGSLHYGFRSDNYIGSTPQKNTPKPDWISFFRDCRLIPQLRMAEHLLDEQTRKRCEKLLERLDTILEEPEFPSLLHGDLWSGNVVCGPDGKAWILDPAVYVGNFEAELAMTELFGGYPAAFYAAYREVNRIEPGYRDRKELYNLYHMLNHLNLFGAAYLGEVKRIVRRYVG